jgi:DNA-binding NtrC family response regulator
VGEKGAMMKCAVPNKHEAFLDTHLIGESLLFREALKIIQRCAQCDATVLIKGETGTGKEVAARAIHYLSNRRNRAFIGLNCGAIPDGLVESTLFGHVQGAFTDAKQSHEGVVTQAKGGTLFLDELEAMSLRGQVALLRFLENQEYQPVGGAETHTADVRVMGATNCDLGVHGGARRVSTRSPISP